MIVSPVTTRKNHRLSANAAFPLLTPRVAGTCESILPFLSGSPVAMPAAPRQNEAWILSPAIICSWRIVSRIGLVGRTVVHSDNINLIVIARARL